MAEQNLSRVRTILIKLISLSLFSDFILTFPLMISFMILKFNLNLEMNNCCMNYYKLDSKALQY
jgi:hypothetical protein